MWVLRQLLASVSHDDEHSPTDDHADEGHHAPFTFEDILYLCILLWVVYVVGKLAAKFCGLPELVGQILAGIVLGPHGAELAPKHEALMLMGEIGLVLMVLEAGIEVELSQLAVVGMRGVTVAIVGSLLPLAIGTALASLAFNMEIKSALAVGASLAPTSMGISLKVLEEGKVLSTPTGQLIIAAAVIDDVIALVLLAQLEALEDPTPINFVIPIISSLAFIFVLGYAAVRVVPNFLANQIVPRLPKNHLEDSLLGLVLLCGTVLMAACHYGRSSHLLGAFLGGLMFCTLSSVKSVWHNKVLKILQWLIRIFFSCSIAFEVPIRDLWTAPILIRAAVFLLAAFGKLATGLFASPYTHREAAKIGFAMSAWGEFAFIVATASREAGTLDSDSYGAVLLAVLLSAVYSPYAVKLAIGDPDAPTTTSVTSLVVPSMKGNELYAEEARRSVDGKPLHHVYYQCVIQCRSKWGLTDVLLKAVHDKMNLDIVDFRIHNAGGASVFDLYMRDRDIWAPNSDEPGPHTEKIEARVQFFKPLLLDIVGGASAGQVLMERWRPVLDDDNRNDDTKAYREAQLNFSMEYPDERMAVKSPFVGSKLMGASSSAASGMELGEDLSEETKFHETLVANHMMSKADIAMHKALNDTRREVQRRARRRSNDSLLAANRMLRSRSRKSRFGTALSTVADVESGVDDNEAMNTVTLSGVTGNQLADEVRKHLTGSLHGHGSLHGRNQTASGEEELSTLDESSDRDHTLSTMTLTGAGGASLAAEIRKQMI
mmetsp:Transcript_47737/g.88835  ORF Transcript_47737/g.88835 Transcript_47737/m.88835 type:complete len:772 (-) Transcript_47737:210-2525(-)